MKNTILTIALLLGLTVVNAQDTTTVDTTGAKATFVTTEINYGSIAKGSDGIREFTFTNTGDTALVITNVKSSCGCTVPSWPHEAIAVGATGTITVKYDTNKVGPINKELRVTMNTNSGSVTLRIKGRVNG